MWWRQNLVTWERYIISQQVLTMPDPNVTNPYFYSLFLCRAILTVASWPFLYILYTMQQSPSWEANRSSASQEIPRILWKSKVNFCIYKIPPHIPILNQINPFHALYTISLKSISILPPIMPSSSKWYLSLRFPYQKYTLPNSCPNFFMHLLLLLLLLCVI